MAGNEPAGGRNARVPPSRIHIVTSTASPEYDWFLKTLRSARVAAIDTEWKPRSETVALVQIAFLGQGDPCSRAIVFLLDLLALPLQELHGPLKELFESPQVLKLGFVFEHDKSHLNHTFGDALGSRDLAFRKVEPLEDISDIYSCIENLSSDVVPYKNPTSLAAICKELLNISLSKELQRSDWSIRPLSEEQITYAATDAYVLLEIFAVSQERIGNYDELTSPGGNESKFAASMANFRDKVAASKLEKELAREKMHFNNEWIGPAPWDPLAGGDGFPKFLCDMMVKGLAKYLHCAGFDASTPQSKPDPRKLIDQVRKEKRVLLTRDVKLLEYVESPNHHVYIVSGMLKADQQREVNETFQLKIPEEQLSHSMVETSRGSQSQKGKPRTLALTASGHQKYNIMKYLATSSDEEDEAEEFECLNIKDCW